MPPDCLARTCGLMLPGCAAGDGEREAALAGLGAARSGVGARRPARDFAEGGSVSMVRYVDLKRKRRMRTALLGLCCFGHFAVVRGVCGVESIIFFLWIFCVV